MIRANLPSFLLQKMLRFEIVAVNYMSTDNTLDVLKELRTKYSNTPVKIVNVPGDKGYNISKARNLGIINSSYENIFTLDADVVCRRTDSMKKWFGNFLALPSENDILETVGGGHLFFKKAVWEKCGGYPTFFCNHGFEDWVFCERAEKVCGSKKFIPSIFYQFPSKQDNEWFFTVKPFRDSQTRKILDGPQRPGFVQAESRWEDESQDTNKLLVEWRKNPDSFQEHPIPTFEIL
jgi:glycosyltransferase involved in cell wall biosynthesis